MREIKFRAWDIECKTMLGWNDICDEIESEGYSMFDQIFRQDHYATMLFTGLRDKRGFEIYEGDILRFYCQGEEFRTGPVQWREEVCNHGVIDLTVTEPEDLFIQRDFPDTFEIIGNIHQTPELLEEEK